MVVGKDSVLVEVMVDETEYERVYRKVDYYDNLKDRKMVVKLVDWTAK